MADEVKDTAVERRLLNRTRRIGGQVGGIEKMIAEGRGCEQVLTQIMAARAALDRLATELVTANLAQCLDNGDIERERETMARVITLLGRAG